MATTIEQGIATTRSASNESYFRNQVSFMRASKFTENKAHRANSYANAESNDDQQICKSFNFTKQCQSVVNQFECCRHSLLAQKLIIV